MKSINISRAGKSFRLLVPMKINTGDGIWQGTGKILHEYGEIIAFRCVDPPYEHGFPCYANVDQVELI